VIRRLMERRESLRQERRSQDQMNAQEARSLEDRIATLSSENDKVSGEIALQRARLRSAENLAARRRAAQQAGVATEDSAQQADDERLEQATRLAALERDRLTAERGRMTLEAELKAHPLQGQEKLAAIDREIATIEQQLAETEAQREIVIPAPASGTVTAVEVDRGSSSDGKVPLLSVVPTGSQLDAHMFCPSRAVGFLKAGQHVLLRYQAYPYQKFGHHEGVVRSISRTALNPGELPPQLSGMTTLIGSGEPVYEVTVTLTSQTVAAYGEQVSLATGMVLEADVIIERRRLVEWMFEPLFTLTGTWAR
jgi:membrane fusion protein